MVRSAMRRFQKQFLQVNDDDDDDDSLSGISNAKSNAKNKKDSGSAGGGANGSGGSGSGGGEVDDRHKEWVVLVNLDKALQLLIEVVLTRGQYVEKKLRQLYVEGKCCCSVV